MSEPANLQNYRDPAPPPLEQPVFDADAGWIELRRWGDGMDYVAWTVVVRSHDPPAVGGRVELCTLRVPIHAWRFDKLNEKARRRALAILRTWRGADGAK